MRAACAPGPICDSPSLSARRRFFFFPPSRSNWPSGRRGLRSLVARESIERRGRVEAARAAADKPRAFFPFSPVIVPAGTLSSRHCRRGSNDARLTIADRGSNGGQIDLCSEELRWRNGLPTAEARTPYHGSPRHPAADG